jgi:hypothetical protein
MIKAYMNYPNRLMTMHGTDCSSVQQHQHSDKHRKTLEMTIDRKPYADILAEIKELHPTSHGWEEWPLPDN